MPRLSLNSNTKSKPLGVSVSVYANAPTKNKDLKADRWQRGSGLVILMIIFQKNNSDDKAELKPLLSSSFAEPKHEPPHVADTVRSFLASFLSCAGAERFAIVDQFATLIE